jgi:hypothetical protein
VARSAHWLLDRVTWVASLMVKRRCSATSRQGITSECARFPCLLHALSIPHML